MPQIQRYLPAQMQYSAIRILRRMRRNTNKKRFLMCFVCLYGVFRPTRHHSRIFHSYWDVTITGKGLQILIYALHPRPLHEQWWFFSVSHLLWHGASVYNGQIWELVTLHSHLLPSVRQWRFHYLFLRLRSVAAVSRTPKLPLARQML